MQGSNPKDSGIAVRSHQVAEDDGLDNGSPHNLDSPDEDDGFEGNEYYKNQYDGGY